MARTRPLEIQPEPTRAKATPDQWMDRLAIVLRAIDAMDQDERQAALVYLKSKYRQEWPGDPSY